MGKLLYFVAGVVVGVCGAAGATWKFWLPIVQLNPTQDVEARVRQNLKDPESARFDKVTFNTETGAGCGYVNAKNSMGGYVGFQSFILYKHGRVDFQDMSEPEDFLSSEKRLEKLQKQIAFLENAKRECATSEK